MKISVRSELVFDFLSGVDAIVSVQAAHSSDQSVLSETLVIDPPVRIVQDAPDERGERRFRATFSGETSIVYEAVIDNGRRIKLPNEVQQASWVDLPQAVVQYLTPSRYCPSDKFILFANREFGGFSPGGARVGGNSRLDSYPRRLRAWR